jgi:hypothetical protein
MTAAGFADVAVDRDHRRHERDLAAFLEGLRRRDRNSQLLTLSDKAYEAGLCRLESELIAVDPRIDVHQICGHDFRTTAATQLCHALKPKLS